VRTLRRASFNAIFVLCALVGCAGDDADDGAIASEPPPTAASTTAASTTAASTTSPAPTSTSPPLALMPAPCAQAVDDVATTIDQRLAAYEPGPDFAEAGRLLAIEVAEQLDAAVAAGCQERQAEVASLVIVHLLNAALANEDDSTSAMGSWAVIHLCESATQVVTLDPDATLICEAAADSASVGTD
jgi:hypothetical protein